MSIKSRMTIMIRIHSVEMCFKDTIMLYQTLHLLSHLVYHGLIVFDNGSLTSMLTDLIHGRGLLSAVVTAG